MHFKLFFVQLCAILSLGTFAVQGQGGYQENARLYILKYKDMAMQEQARTGVPAAIKLAQGIYETAGGKSELCERARNHFGIKCKSGWTGLTYAYTDDAQDECFRSYSTDQHSYTDHSDFLKANPRYKSLFSIDPSDYKAWARGLKKCGYATNPAYAEKLIQTIEIFGLQQYTREAATLRNDGTYLGYALPEDSLNSGTLNPEDDSLHPQSAGDGSLESGTITQMPDAGTEDKETDPLVEYYVTTEKNGIKGFYAKKGDLLLEYALTHRVRYARLLEWNNLPDAPLEENMFIYLSKKRRSGLVPHYTVERGMTMQLISQKVGVDLASLMFYNKLAPNEQPVPGAVLNLQGPIESKPEVYTLRKTGRESAARSRNLDRDPEEGYIYKKDIDDGVYTMQSNEMTVDAEPEGLPVSEAAKSLAAGPDKMGGDDESATDVQELSRKEKRALKKVEKEEEELTPLEKLKQHMDRNVYANPDGDWREEDPVDQGEAPETTEQITTFPARNTKASNTGNKPPVEKSTTRGETYHTVRSGDTAFSIAKRYGISLKQLRAWNNLPTSMVVQKGQRLRVAP